MVNLMLFFLDGNLHLDICIEFSSVRLSKCVMVN